MHTKTTVEERAQRLVQVRTKVAGGPWFIELNDLLSEPMQLGPYANPAAARTDAARLQTYLAALIRETKRPAATGIECRLRDGRRWVPVLLSSSPAS